MASSWGTSWGTSWGDSWGATGGVTPPAPAVVTTSGGFITGTLHRRKREPVFVDYGTLAERLRLEPPKAVEIIENVAVRQSEDLRLDENQRFEELERELAAQGVRWKAQYLELLNARRQQIIDLEIGERIKLLQNNNNRTILLLISQI